MTQLATSVSVKAEKLMLSSGKVIRFPYPVKKALEFDEAIVVVLDVPPGEEYSENVFAVGHDGKILWRIKKHPRNLDVSKWLDLNREGDNVQIGNWDGLELIVEPATGRILKEWIGR